jgi:type IV secretion system protein VirD4
VRREPELPDYVAIVRETANAPAHEEFAIIDDESEEAARQARILRQQMRGVARQASLDPADGLEL